MSAVNRKSLAAKVAALLAKTVEAGATPAEAEAALAMAKSLMDRYQIDLGAVGLEEEGTRKESILDAFQHGLRLRSLMGSAIAKFTDTRYWTSGRSEHNHFMECNQPKWAEKVPVHIHFLGLQSDVDFAVWLADHLAQFCLAELTRHRLNLILESDLTMITPQEQAAFLTGATDRINNRLDDLVLARQQTSTGTSLIVLKNQLVKKAWKEHGPKNLSYVSNTGVYGRHTSAGAAAGDRASFARPASYSRPLMIGDK